MSLKEKAIGGAKWTTVSAVISAVVQLLQIAILAHFLDKKDFGLMALAVFVIGISQIFMDMGISNAIIYKKDVTHEQLSTMYWLNICMGVLIYLLLFILAPFVAAFYHEPKLVGVLNWIALTFVIQPFGQQFETLLIKGLRFRALAIRDVFSKTIGLISGVLLAYFHFGVYSLVFANLLMATISTLLLIIIGLRFHKPGFFFSLRDLKEQGFLSFGLYQIGEKVINYFNAQCDTLIVGKLLGMDVEG
jgi:O-antigen/teichoic acid export membrane protein